MHTMGVTGHRPDKLGGYDAATYDQLRYFAESLIARYQPEVLISGMAQGWDLACAQAAVLRKVRLIAMVPFEGQESVWPEQPQKLYRAMLARAAEVRVVSEGEYAAWKMQVRNEAIVDAVKLAADDGAALIALYDGHSTGGTHNCIEYAKRQGIPVVNVWHRWLEWRREHAAR